MWTIKCLLKIVYPIQDIGLSEIFIGSVNTNNKTAGETDTFKELTEKTRYNKMYLIPIR